MKFPEFEYCAPTTPDEVVRLLSERPGDSKIVAGGQSLLPTMAYRMAQPGRLVDLRKVPDLNRIEVDAQGIRLGARTRWRDIDDSDELRDGHPLLKDAVRHIAHYQVRNRGTVGGSLAHADPASELPCVAVTCDAELRLLGPGGERTVPASEFILGPLSTALQEDELIVALHLPHWPRQRRWAFQEFSRRKGDFALAGIALYYDLDASQRLVNAHVGVFGACDRSHRLERVEAALNGRVLDEAAVTAAVQTAREDVNPNTDVHASAAYRRALVGTLLQRALIEAQARAPA